MQVETIVRDVVDAERRDMKTEDGTFGFHWISWGSVKRVTKEAEAMDGDDAISK